MSKSSASHWPENFMVIGAAILPQNLFERPKTGPKTGVILSHLKKPNFYYNENLNLYVMHSLKFVYLIANSVLFIVPFI